MSEAFELLASSAPESRSPRGNRKTTILLVDDHALVRKGFRRILEDESDFSVVGEAGDGSQALQLFNELRPDIVLMDCSIPRSNGIQVARQILEKSPAATIIMLSMHSEETWVRDALDAGARAYLVKNAEDMDLISVIRRVQAGEMIFPFDPHGPVGGTVRVNCGLSAREMEVLQLIVNGRSNRQIAAQLNLSANTVAAHRSNIMKTLRIHRTATLVAYAVRKGLARPS